MVIERFEIDDTSHHDGELFIITRYDDGQELTDFINIDQQKQLRDHLTKVIDEFENR